METTDKQDSKGDFEPMKKIAATLKDVPRPASVEKRLAIEVPERQGNG